MYPTFENQLNTEITVGDKVVKINLGKFGEQTCSDVLAQCGDTIVNCTLTVGGESTLDYFPLSVEFIEKLYAGGIIKGSRWVKREGRPSDASVLKSRVIDRSIRPLFPEGFRREVQVVNTVFSYDKQNPDDMIGMLATGVALAVGGVPFEGPIAGIRVGYIKDEDRFIINPTVEEQALSELNLIVSGGLDSIVMVEAGAKELPEEIMLRALATAQEELHKICVQIEQIAAEYKKPLLSYENRNAGYDDKDKLLRPYLEKIDLADVVAREAKLEEVDLSEQFEQIAAEEPVVAAEYGVSDIKEVWHQMEKEFIRAKILNEGIRSDGRKTTEIRPITCEVDLFPRTHGSAMFKRGATQAVTVTTLGSPSLGQMIEDMGGEDIRHYMHFYSMPPYASGEAGRIGSPKRREIGHGALAERALVPVLPDQEEFPYTIHVVSEILSSNGSTSQASVCGSTLSLMSAGVPIKRPVAGIAMGLITDGDKYQILSDIKDVEDHCGDMDFKVAGTEYGITALQMDIKIKGISIEILTKALAQAREGRLFILDKMLACIAAPRDHISQYAPKIVQLVIPADRIGELIGPGGKNIKSIIETSGAEIDVEENDEKQVGEVNICSANQEAIDKAKEMIENLMHVDAIGDEFDGKVTRIESYGAFVEYGYKKEGLVHVSQMTTGYLDDPHKVVKLGDVVHARIFDIQPDGKVKLTLLTREQEAEQKAQRANNRSDFKGGRARNNNRRDNHNRSGYNGRPSFGNR
ncbi:polyribonucleotide nucleotidyltransferase [bacterium]|nr:polyribonucleotide nucleotidyltransferase [bacterium]MBQ6436295.1 polyribonucleotide nucleotidyltransferase [bacterium]